jgi:hypothetical protein
MNKASLHKAPRDKADKALTIPGTKYTRSCWHRSHHVHSWPDRVHGPHNVSRARQVLISPSRNKIFSGDVAASVSRVDDAGWMT